MRQTNVNVIKDDWRTNLPGSCNVTTWRKAGHSTTAVEVPCWVPSTANKGGTAGCRPKRFRLDRNDTLRSCNPSAFRGCTEDISFAPHHPEDARMRANRRGRSAAPPSGSWPACCYVHRKRNAPVASWNGPAIDPSIKCVCNEHVLRSNRNACKAAACDIRHCPEESKSFWDRRHCTMRILAGRKCWLGIPDTLWNVLHSSTFRYDTACTARVAERRWFGSFWRAAAWSDVRWCPWPSTAARSDLRAVECSWCAICLPPSRRATWIHRCWLRSGTTRSEPEKKIYRPATRGRSFQLGGWRLRYFLICYVTWNSKMASSSGYWYV